MDEFKYKIIEDRSRQNQEDKVLACFENEQDRDICKDALEEYFNDCHFKSQEEE